MCIGVCGAILSLCVLTGARVDFSDPEVSRRVLVESCFVRDDSRVADMRLRHVLHQAFQDDTNSFANFIVEVSKTNHLRIAKELTSMLGVYGTSDQLPHLYSLCTNACMAQVALESMLRVGGVTTNALGIAGAYLSMTNASRASRANVCIDLLRFAERRSVRDDVWTNVFTLCQSYAASNTYGVVGMDKSLIRFNPDYRNTKRRLAVLRKALEREITPYQRNYIMNAVNELVAYPEANLPE